MLSLAEIAQRAQGRVVGDDQTVISGVGSLAHARSGDLTHFSNPRFKAQLRATKASAVLLSESAVADCPVVAVVVDHPQFAFAQIVAAFDKREQTLIGIHATAQIDASVQLGKDVRIGPFVEVGAHCVIGDRVELCTHVCIGAHSHVGEDSSIRANTVIYHDVRLGARCSVHGNTTIGADGFGIVADGQGQLQEIPQVGRVIIGDDVLIGASSTIDRGAIDDTVIEDNVKIDDQVHIGHNCQIGAHSILCGRVALGGSVSLGKYCVLAGAVGIVGDGPVALTDGVQVGAMTYVGRDISEPGRYSGSTLHTDNRTWRRNALRFNELDALAKRLRRVEEVIDNKSSTRTKPFNAN